MPWVAIMSQDSFYKELGPSELEAASPNIFNRSDDIPLPSCFFFVLRSNPLLIARATRKLSAHCGHVILDTTPLIDVQAHNNNYDFDAPDSIDIELLCSTLRKLKEGQRIKVPIYDFGTHSRSPETEEMYVL